MRKRERLGPDYDRWRADIAAHDAEEIHLLKTRGGALCGRRGRTEADINAVTCPRCIYRHDRTTTEAVPACAASMGCLCAWHAVGAPADDPCDTDETRARDWANAVG